LEVVFSRPAVGRAVPFGDPTLPPPPIGPRPPPYVRRDQVPAREVAVGRSGFFCFFFIRELLHFPSKTTVVPDPPV